jgi:hypothetical protein
MASKARLKPIHLFLVRISLKNKTENKVLAKTIPILLIGKIIVAFEPCKVLTRKNMLK